MLFISSYLPYHSSYFWSVYYFTTISTVLCVAFDFTKRCLKGEGLVARTAKLRCIYAFYLF